MQLPNGGFASAQDSESVIDGARNEGGYYRLDAVGPRPDSTPPALDEKVLTGWNGLAIGALARAGVRVRRRRGDARPARRAADFLLEHHLLADGTLVRASLDGIASSAAVATLEDTGMLAGGLLELAVATGERRYAVTARGASSTRALAAGPRPGDDERRVAARFRAHRAERPGARRARPRASRRSGRGCDSLGRHGLRGRRVAAVRCSAQANATATRPRTSMRAVAGIAVERPIAFGGALELMARLAAPVVQLVTVRARRRVRRRRATPTAAGATALTEATRRHAASVAVIVHESQARAFADAGFELFEGRAAPDARPAAYRCDSFVCALPVTDAVALDALASAR